MQKHNRYDDNRGSCGGRQRSTPMIGWRGFMSVGAVLAILAMGGAPSAVAQEDGYAASMRAGRAAYKQNDMATAQRHFEEALKDAETDRQKSSAHYAIGVVSQKQNKLADAQQHAEKALAINPEDKQAKGLLDEVNAPPAKKGQAKGLAKTPLPPGAKPAAAIPKSAAAPKQAGAAKPAAVAAPAATTAAATPGEAPPLPKPKKPLPKPAAAKAPIAPGQTGATPAAAKKPAAAGEALPPGAVPPPPGKSGALPESERRAGLEVPPSAASSAAVAITTEPVEKPALDVQEAAKLGEVGARLASTTQPPAVAAAPLTPAALITTGSLPAGVAAAANGETAKREAKFDLAAVHPTALAPSEKRAVAEQPLPALARFVEMTCGLDYRRDGRTFARAFEITAAKGGRSEGEIIGFEITCEKVAGGHVPRTLLGPGEGDIVRVPLRRASEGGWSYFNPRSEREVRVRLEGETLTLVPPAAEVAVLRRKLAENPAQLAAMEPTARRNFELAVSGEGYPEFRAVRAADKLDAVFEQAAKLAKRVETTLSGVQAVAPAHDR